MRSSRRSVLRALIAGSATVCAAGAAGCLGREHATDLWIKNKSGSTRTVAVRAVRVDSGEELLAETIVLEDGEVASYDEVAGEFNCEVGIEVEDGPSNRRVWRDSGSDSYTLMVSIKRSVIIFREAAV